MNSHLATKSVGAREPAFHFQCVFVAKIHKRAINHPSRSCRTRIAHELAACIRKRFARGRPLSTHVDHEVALLSSSEPGATNTWLTAQQVKKSAQAYACFDYHRNTDRI